MSMIPMGASILTPTMIDRREMIRLSVAGAGAAVFAAGCGATQICPAPAAAVAGVDDAARALMASPLTIVERAVGEVSVLRRLAAPITEVDVDVLELLESRMRDALEATGSGVGLAAPQGGIGARAVLVRVGARGDDPRTDLYVNPRIVERSDEGELDYEGCLSIPGVCGLVRRSRAVVVEHGLVGAPHVRLEVEGFDARIFQHEVDHLDGALYLDRLIGELHPSDQIRQLREELAREREPEEVASFSGPALL